MQWHRLETIFCITASLDAQMVTQHLAGAVANSGTGMATDFSHGDWHGGSTGRDVAFPTTSACGCFHVAPRGTCYDDRETFDRDGRCLSWCDDGVSISRKNVGTPTSKAELERLPLSLSSETIKQLLMNRLRF
jgi:hypothetical protein